MRYYPALITLHHDQRLGIVFPDLPECTAMADTWGDVPRTAVQAMRLWFHDKSDIEPTNIDDLRERSDIKPELANGAVLLLIPRRL